VARCKAAAGAPAATLLRIAAAVGIADAMGMGGCGLNSGVPGGRAGQNTGLQQGKSGEAPGRIAMGAGGCGAMAGAIEGVVGKETGLLQGGRDEAQGCVAIANAVGMGAWGPENCPGGRRGKETDLPQDKRGEAQGSVASAVGMGGRGLEDKVGGRGERETGLQQCEGNEAQGSVEIADAVGVGGRGVENRPGRRGGKETDESPCGGDKFEPSGGLKDGMPVQMNKDRSGSVNDQTPAGVNDEMSPGGGDGPFGSVNGEMSEGVNDETRDGSDGRRTPPEAPTRGVHGMKNGPETSGGTDEHQSPRGVNDKTSEGVNDEMSEGVNDDTPGAVNDAKSKGVNNKIQGEGGEPENGEAQAPMCGGDETPSSPCEIAGMQSPPSGSGQQQEGGAAHLEAARSANLDDASNSAPVPNIDAAVPNADTVSIFGDGPTRRATAVAVSTSAGGRAGKARGAAIREVGAAEGRAAIPQGGTGTSDSARAMCSNSSAAAGGSKDGAGCSNLGSVDGGSENGAGGSSVGSAGGGGSIPGPSAQHNQADGEEVRRLAETRRHCAPPTHPMSAPQRTLEVFFSSSFVSHNLLSTRQRTSYRRQLGPGRHILLLSTPLASCARGIRHSVIFLDLLPILR
jgi:hypothetical protein